MTGNDYRWIKVLSDSHLVLHLQAQEKSKHPDTDLVDAIRQEFKDRTEREQEFRKILLEWNKND